MKSKLKNGKKKRKSGKKHRKLSNAELYLFEEGIALANRIPRYIKEIIDIIQNGGDIVKLIWLLTQVTRAAYQLKIMLIRAKNEAKDRVVQDE